MPSEKKTSRSPGWVESVNSSYSASGKRPRGKPSALIVRTRAPLVDRGIGRDEERLDGAGVGDLECLVGVVPDGHEHGDVLRVELALLELVVERGEHGRGRELLRRERAKNPADQRGVERGWRGLCR